LYQTDWLLRIYHYKLNDLKEVINEQGNLPRGDPKIHLATDYFKDRGPVDPNIAPYQELIRVPGIGPISAKRIINLRKQKISLNRRQDLKSIGVILKRADPFLKINGNSQTTMGNFMN
jgi:predicted DNA-binding helix-hairpin-helix protein